MTLEDRIKEEEGFRLAPYDDATGKALRPGDTLQGNITIGWGTNLSSGISRMSAQYLLSERLAIAQLDAAAVFGRVEFYSFPQKCQEAFLDMLYQMGRKRFMTFKKMIEAAKRNDWKSVKREALDSEWARGPHKKRAEEIGALFDG